jgi:MFS family permease
MSLTEARPRLSAARLRSGPPSPDLARPYGAQRGLRMVMARTAQELGSAVRRPPGAPPAALPLRMLQWLIGSGLLPFRRDEFRRDEPKSASWHVLRHRRFLIYFGGSLVSNLGTWLQNTAQMLLAYQLTHSAFAVGLVTSAQFAGFLLIGPWAAAMANRVGSRRVLVASQVVSAGIAAALAGLQLTGSLNETQLTLGALGIGLAFAFALPVQTAMVSGLVPEDETKAAMAMNSVSYNAGRTLAPVLCVAVIASIGAGWAFALNAISFIVFAITIIVVRPRAAPPPPREARDWLGLRIAVRRPRILLLLAMVAAVTLADDPVLVLGPPLARHLAVPTVWPAYFLSALGLGTVVGALVPTRPSTAKRAALPLLGLAISVIVFTAGFSAWLSLGSAIAAGAAGLLTGAAAQALLLKTAGPRQATQVMALWAIAWAGSKPLASLADGWMAGQIGVQWTGVVLTAPAITVAMLELFLRPGVKNRLKVWIYQRNGTHPAAQLIS